MPAFGKNIKFSTKKKKRTDLSLENKHCSHFTTISTFPQKTRLELTFTKHCASFLSHFSCLPRHSTKSGPHPHSPAAAAVGINAKVVSWDEAWVQVSAGTGLSYLGTAANPWAEAFASYSVPTSHSLSWHKELKRWWSRNQCSFWNHRDFKLSWGKLVWPGAASNTKAALSHLGTGCYVQLSRKPAFCSPLPPELAMRKDFSRNRMAYNHSGSHGKWAGATSGRLLLALSVLPGKADHADADAAVPVRRIGPGRQK